jgi:hypothetical protein
LCIDGGIFTQERALQKIVGYFRCLQEEVAEMSKVLLSVFDLGSASPEEDTDSSIDDRLERITRGL